MNFFYRYIDAKYLSSRNSKDLQIQIFLSVMLIVTAIAHMILVVYFTYVVLFRDAPLVSYNSLVYIGISIVGVAIYLIAFAINKAGKIRAASLVYVVSMTLFAVSATYFIGADVNAQWLVLLAVLPTVLYFDFSKVLKACLVIALPILVNFLFALPFLCAIPARYQSSVFLKFFYVNTVVIATLFILAVNEIISRKLSELRARDIEAYKNISNIDPLSQLNNRRYAEIYFEQLELGRQDASCVFCMLDIDNFKTVNDRYGHDVGDIVIKTVSDILRRNIRQTDLACRWGGEEFLLVMSSCDLPTGLLILEKIRYAIENEHIPTDHGVIRITITGGACLIVENNLKVTLDACDKKLYEGKHNGKNRIVC